MNFKRVYGLVRADQFDEDHRCLDDGMKHASREDGLWIHHRRVGVYLDEKRYQDAIADLKAYRGT